MRQIMVVLAVVAVALCGCGHNPVSPNGQTDFALSSGPVSAAKPISGLGVSQNLRGAQVFAVITKNGVPFFGDPYMSLRFSRSISGRARSYDWGSGIGTDSVSRFQVVTLDDPSGMYCAQLKDGSGKVIGEWASIPVNERKSINTFILSIGEQAKVVSNDEFQNFVGPGQLRVSVSTYPTAGDVVAGKVGHTFTNIIFDATEASEDIVISKVRSQLSISTPGTASDMSNGQMFDGITALNNGPLIINPSAGMRSGDEVEFKMGLALTVPKGTFKTISMRFNVSANPSGISGVSIYAWGIKENPETIVAFGAVSGKRVGVYINGSGGQPWRLRASGGLSIALDSITPPFYVKGGSTNVLVFVIKISASYEDILLHQLEFQANGNFKAIAKLTLWDNFGTKRGEGVFASDNHCIVTIFPLWLLFNFEDRRITVKADFWATGVAQPAKSGDKIGITYQIGGVWGVGASSGAKIYPTDIVAYPFTEITLL